MRARRCSPPMTKKMAATAKYLVEKLGLAQHQVAALLGVNQGRISEVITGKRFADVEPANQLSLDLG